MFYPDYFVSYFDFQFFHYLNWNCNLPIRTYLAYLDDSLGHRATLERYCTLFCLKVWKERKEKKEKKKSKIVDTLYFEQKRKKSGICSGVWKVLIATIISTLNKNQIAKKRKESEKVKWQWFRKDAWGFTLGVLSMLLGIYEFVLYADAVGQRGAEILVYTGGLLIFAGLTHNVYITICWLRNKTGRHTDTRD